MDDNVGRSAGPRWHTRCVLVPSRIRTPVRRYDSNHSERRWNSADPQIYKDLSLLRVTRGPGNRSSGSNGPALLLRPLQASVDFTNPDALGFTRVFLKTLCL